MAVILGAFRAKGVKESVKEIRENEAFMTSRLCSAVAFFCLTLFSIGVGRAQPGEEEGRASPHAREEDAGMPAPRAPDEDAEQTPPVERREDATAEDPEEEAEPDDSEDVGEEPEDEAADEEQEATDASLESRVRRALMRTPGGSRCDFRDVLEHEGAIHIACGPRGLWRFERQPNGKWKREDVRYYDGEVVALFERDGALWVELARRTAQPVLSRSPGAPPVSPPGSPSKTEKAPAPQRDTAPPAKTSVPEPETPPLLERSGGEVIEVEPGEVIVDMGREHGVTPGDWIEILEVERMSLARGDSVRRETRLAVGEVTAASQRQAKVALGLNERARVGNLARPTGARRTADSVAPPRAAGLWDTGFMARPFLPMNDLGVGLLGHAWLGYRFEGPWHVEARLSPAGVAVGEGEDVATAIGVVVASLDVQLLEIGLGLGAQTMNQPDFGLDSGSGLTVAQVLRVGARDGLHLRVQTEIVLFHQDFEFSGATAHVQVPVGHGVWLVGNGGGGSAGHAFGEVGLRVLARGNGGPGSIFVTATVGGSGLHENSCVGRDFTTGACIDRTDQTLAGPSLGIGGEWRL